MGSFLRGKFEGFLEKKPSGFGGENREDFGGDFLEIGERGETGNFGF